MQGLCKKKNDCPTSSVSCVPPQDGPAEGNTEEEDKEVLQQHRPEGKDVDLVTAVLTRHHGGGGAGGHVEDHVSCHIRTHNVRIPEDPNCSYAHPQKQEAKNEVHLPGFVKDVSVGSIVMSSDEEGHTDEQLG